MANSTAGKVLKNTGVIISGNIVSILLGLITNILIVRYLGARDLGLYSSIFVSLSFFSIITDMGIGSILIREVAKDRERADKLIGNAILIKLMLSVVAISIFLIAASLVKCPVDIKMMAYIGAISFLFSFSSLFRIIFHVNLRMGYPIFADVINVIVKLAMALGLIYLKAGLVWFVVIEVLANIPGIIITYRASTRFLRPKIEIDLKIWKLILQESWPLAVGSVFAMLYLRIDVIMLLFMKGSSAVGYYSAAYKLTDALALLPAAFMTSVFPLMSHYFKHSPESLTKAYGMAFRLMISIILPVAVIVTMLAPRIIDLLYGRKFSSSIPALSILIWAQVFVYINAVMHFMIISVKKQKATMINLALIAFLNIALNYILIPAYGFVGTGTARVATEAFGAVLGIAWLSSFGYKIPLFSIISKPLLGALASGAFLALFPQVNMYVTVPIAALIYFAVEFAVGGISKEDIAILKGCFARDEETVYAGV